MAVLAIIPLILKSYYFLFYQVPDVVHSPLTFFFLKIRESLKKKNLSK